MTASISAGPSSRRHKAVSFLIGNGAPFLLGAILFIAALLKVATLEHFIELSTTFTLLPAVIRPWVPLAVPLAELSIAGLLFVPGTARVGLWASVILLLVFTAYLVVQWFNPYVPPCNCFGVVLLARDAVAANRLGIARNCLLLALACHGLRARRSIQRDIEV